MIDFAKLKAPFPADKISWRVGSTNKDKTRGMALAYIDARDVQDRLDSVCGPENWQNDFPHANGKTVCRIGIKIADEWIWKANGAGDTDFEAEKGALSSAFKRAAVMWGIGEYLYDVDAPWVAIEAAGKSFKIAANELPGLRAILEGGGRTRPAPPAEKPRQTPEQWAALAQDQIKACVTEAQLTSWLQTNAAALEKLQSKAPPLANTLTVLIKLRKDEFAGKVFA